MSPSLIIHIPVRSGYMTFSKVVHRSFVGAPIQKFVNPPKMFVKFSLQERERRNRSMSHHLRQTIKKQFFEHLVENSQKMILRKHHLVEQVVYVMLLAGKKKSLQNKMRKTGFLACLIDILTLFLNDRERWEGFDKGAQIIIYSILRSVKNPWNSINQNELKCLIPKLLNYLQCENSFLNRRRIETAKCFWSFLTSIIYHNDRNQEIFVKSSGLIILFRALQNVLENAKASDLEDLLEPITGSMAALMHREDFGRDAFNFCCITILTKVAKSSNVKARDRAVAALKILKVRGRVDSSWTWPQVRREQTLSIHTRRTTIFHGIGNILRSQLRKFKKTAEWGAERGNTCILHDEDYVEEEKRGRNLANEERLHMVPLESHGFLFEALGRLRSLGVSLLYGKKLNENRFN